MHNFHAISGVAEVLADLLGDHDGAVLSAGAAEGDRQIALAFVNVVRQKVDQQVGDAGDELAGLGKRADVFGDPRVAPGQRTEFGHEMRVGQKAHVEDKVGILGNALTESEAHAGDQNAFLRRLFLKAFGDVSAQFVNVELRSVDDEIGDGAGWRRGDGVPP